MLKTIATILLIVISQSGLRAQGFEWAKPLGGSGYEYSYGISANDSGVVGVGRFDGTADFDPGPATFNLTSAGDNDIYIQKLGSNGEFQWAIRLGSTNRDRAHSVVIDNSGDIYVTGFFQGTVDFNPGSDTFNLVNVSTNYDNFVLKLDSSGNFIWAKSFGGIGLDQANAIEVDALGNVYVTGYFLSTADFDPGPGVYNMTSSGSFDMFIVKLNSSGDLVWAKKNGGAGHQEGTSIKVDNLGNIYTAGHFSLLTDFDPGSNTSNHSSVGDRDAFVQKLDSTGNLIWVKTMGGVSSYAYSNSLDIDDLGNAYTTGYFSGTLDLNPEPNNLIVNSAGEYDLFVQKLDSSGNFLWAKHVGGSSSDISNSIAVDYQGNAYITGYFLGTVDFDPGISVHHLISSGSYEIFALKLTFSGNFAWANAMGGTGDDRGYAIAVDDQKNVYTTGVFSGTADFDPGVNITTLDGPGSFDIYVHKFSPCYTQQSIDNVIACDSFTWIDGNTYYNSTSTPMFTLFNSEGCDSIITLNLTINNSSSGIDIQTACDSYTWIDGVTYTSSTNAPTFTLTNVAGCDSVVTLNLTINNSTTGTDIQTACNSYTWIDGVTYYASTNSPTWTLTNAAGCDSIVTLNLNINNSTTGTDIQTACDSLTWIDGVTYTSSTNTPTWTLINVAGCDSVVALNLTIIPSIPTVAENTFSLPSDPNNCVGQFAIDLSGNGDFDLDIDNGAQTATTSGYQLFTGLCAGVHDLQIINFCGDTTVSQFVIPVDSNYVFTNPFIDSLAQDSLGSTIEDCDIYYAGIDTAYIDSIWATGNIMNVIWNIVDSNGSNLDTTVYELNNENGVYWLQLSVFCPVKALGDYFTVTESIYFENGTVSIAGIGDLEETNVLIYPNPTNNMVTISFEGTEAELTIYDAQGKLIRNRSTIHSGEQVSLSHVQTGVYFFELSTNEGKTVKRVVKN